MRRASTRSWARSPTAPVTVEASVLPISIYPFGGAPPVVQTQSSNFGTFSIGNVQTQLVASGGDGTYTWTVVGGLLPPGLSIRTDKPSGFSASASAGIIGLATTPGTYNFTLRVSSDGQTADVASTMKITGFTLKIQARCRMRTSALLTPTPLPRSTTPAA